MTECCRHLDECSRASVCTAEGRTLMRINDSAVRLTQSNETFSLKFRCERSTHKTDNPFRCVT